MTAMKRTHFRPTAAPTRGPSRRTARLLRQTAAAALTAALLMGTALQPAALAAQSFGPAIRVNDLVITQYELDQRTLLMQLLNAPEDPAKIAREQLIDERLKSSAAKRFNLSASPEEVDAGVAEFASRGGMQPEEFMAALQQAGISQESFREFIANGVVWRQLVRGMFGSKVKVTEADIDRAIAQQSRPGGLRVLLSEIFIPAQQNPAAAEALAMQISQLDTTDAFSAAARQYSAAETRTNGGQLEWMDISTLPPQLQTVIAGLSPGEVSEPLQVSGAYALFQLRGIQETGVPRVNYSDIDYAIYYIDGGRTPETLARAQQIENTTDTCNDLYGVAKGQPEQVLERVSLPPSQIPQDIAIELAKLNPNQFSTNLTRNNGQTLALLMLCSRTPQMPDGQDIDRAQVAKQLQTNRLGSFADGYLAQLRSEARIVE